MFVLIDNYDSFTFNLWQALALHGVQVEVVRNDAASVATVLGWAPTAIVLSPGPRSPDDAGICVELVRAASGHVPLLGVCLGHQAIGRAFGARVERATVPMHGRQSIATLDEDVLFDGLPREIPVGRYHSLVVAAESLGPALVATAWCKEVDGRATLMAMRHREHPTWGVQFHPESVLTPDGARLLGNFVEISTRYRRRSVAGNDAG